jgi:glutathione transport system ATP-binding protein
MRAPIAGEIPVLSVDGTRATVSAEDAAARPKATTPTQTPSTPPATDLSAHASIDRAASPILRVRDLVTRFPVKSGVFGRVSQYVHAVERVSFDLHAGETLALVGESGCGKSTTGRSLLRLVESQSGSIEFDGRDISALRGHDLQALRRNIQFIFQDPFASLDPR